MKNLLLLFFTTVSLFTYGAASTTVTKLNSAELAGGINVQKYFISGTTNLDGTNPTFDCLGPGVATITLTNDTTITFANIPTTGRQIWELLMRGNSTSTVTFAGLSYVIPPDGGTFVNPPSSSLVTYRFDHVGNTNYLYILQEILSSEVSAALDKINNTQGNVLVRGASGWTNSGVGTTGQVLASQGAGNTPAWTNSAAGSSLGFPLVVANAVAATLGDGGTYYFGSYLASTLAQAGTYTNASIRIPVNGTLTRAWIRTRLTTLSDGGADATFFVRLNDTTDLPIFTNTLATTVAENFQTLNTAVTTNDYIALKITTGTWATTNPAGGWWVTLVIQ